MALLGGNTPTEKSYSEGFDKRYIEDVEFCGELIRRYMYEEAWSVMNTLRPESVPLLVGKAICLYETDRFGDCIKICERVLSLLGTTKNSLSPALPEDMQALHKVQKNQSTYLEPVSFRYVELFPQTLRDSVLRIIVNCWSELGNTAKVIEIGTPLLSKGYRNVMEAFYKIDHPDPYPPTESGYELGEDGKVYFIVNGQRQ